MQITQCNPTASVMVVMRCIQTTVTQSDSTTKSAFIWSQMPEQTLPLSYSGRGSFLLVSLQNQPTIYIWTANPSRGENSNERGISDNLGVRGDRDVSPWQVG